MVESIKELRKICQPPQKGKRYYWIWNMKKISIYFTKLFLILGITANQTSLLQIIFAISSFFPLIFFQNWFNVILSALLLNISYLFDNIDGELARYHGPTYYGRLLENVGHDIFYFVFLFIGFGLYFKYNNLIFIILGISASLFKTLLRLHEMRFEYLNIKIKVKKKSGKIAKFAYDLGLAHIFLPILYILALLNLLQFFLYFYGIYIPIFWFVWLCRKHRLINRKDKGSADERKLWANIREHI